VESARLAEGGAESARSARLPSDRPVEPRRPKPALTREAQPHRTHFPEPWQASPPRIGSNDCRSANTTHPRLSACSPSYTPVRLRSSLFAPAERGPARPYSWRRSAPPTEASSRSRADGAAARDRSRRAHTPASRGTPTTAATHDPRSGTCKPGRRTARPTPRRHEVPPQPDGAPPRTMCASKGSTPRGDRGWAAAGCTPDGEAPHSLRARAHAQLAAPAPRSVSPLSPAKARVCVPTKFISQARLTPRPPCRPPVARPRHRPPAPFTLDEK
jgi:hypothetical protein